jgi:hypothetical protein
MSHHACIARAYPRNSPEAAGRLVALALLANGEVKTKEWAVLQHLRVCEQLGLEEDAWQDILECLCTELPALNPARDTTVLDEALLAGWLGELDDPELQRRVLRLSTGVAQADGHVDPGESLVLRGMLQRWVLPEDEQAGVAPLLYGLDFQVVPRRALPATS